MLEEDFDTEDLDEETAPGGSVVWLLDDENHTVITQRVCSDKYEKAIREMAKTYSPLPKIIEMETAVRAKEKDITAKLQLFLHTTNLIVILIDKVGGANAKSSFGDLYHECLEALEKAFQKFEPTRGVLFRTYARSWVVHAISNYTHEDLVYYPRRICNNNRKILAAIEHLSQELDREPTIAEIAQRTGLSVKVVTSMQSLSKLQQAHSLDENFYEAREICQFDSLRSLAAEEELERLEALREAISKLGERQKLVVKKHLGLGDETATSLPEIAQTLKLSERRVRALYGAAKRNLVRFISESLEEPEIARRYFERVERKAQRIRTARGKLA